MTASGRDDLAALPELTIPGKPPGAILLNANESPGPPSAAVVAAITEAALQGNRYPTWFSEELVAKLARHLGVDASWIAVGCGSMSLCQQLIQAVCVGKDEVLCAWRSFEAYPVMAQVHGVGITTVPLTVDHRHDLEGMLGALTEHTRLVFICNPNNPTGTAVRSDELTRFLDKVPPDVVVVMDEAYREFVTDPDVPDGIPLALERENMAVLRTFSKGYGLAGIRVGYCVAPPALVSVVSKVAVPFATSRIAQAAGLAALDEVPAAIARCAAVTVERERVAGALRAAGYEVPDSQANFVWLPLGPISAAFGDHCAAHSIMVRVFANDGVRVTSGLPEENDAFLAAATQFTERRPSC
jgi:histidinol-phosphate aminotransferase